MRHLTPCEDAASQHPPLCLIEVSQGDLRRRNRGRGRGSSQKQVGPRPLHQHPPAPLFQCPAFKASAIIPSINTACQQRGTETQAGGINPCVRASPNPLPLSVSPPPSSPLPAIDLISNATSSWKLPLIASLLWAPTAPFSQGLTIISGESSPLDSEPPRAGPGTGPLQEPLVSGIYLGSR